MKKALANATLVSVALLLVVMILELVLRLWPVVISPAVLTKFERELQRQIAARLDLPLKQARRCISSAERADGGPELCLIAPGTLYRHPVDAGDLVHGAESLLPHDARGFCNPADKTARMHAAIVSVGDSFTWCTVVPPDATFTAELETMLGVTTYNLGVPGIGPYEYLEILRRFGLALKPRIVLFNIYEGNDLRDAARFADHRARTASSDRSATITAVSSQSFLAHSYALNFIAGSIEQLVEQARPPEIDFRYRITARGHEIRMNAGQADRDEVKYARRLRQAATPPALWDLALQDLATLAQEHRFTPVVVYIPAAYTAHAATAVFADPAIGEDMAAMSEAQRTHLRARTTAEGLLLVDLTEPVQAAVASSDLAYFPFNLHLTEVGHAIVAAALAPTLAELLADLPATAVRLAP